jgi:hypothetical protein
LCIDLMIQSFDHSPQSICGLFLFYNGADFQAHSFLFHQKIP